MTSWMRWIRWIGTPMAEPCGDWYGRVETRLSAGAQAVAGMTAHPMFSARRKRGKRRFQETAEACLFLGAAGIVVPNVRTPDSKNLVIFCEQNTWIEKEIVHNHGVIDLRQPASR